MAYTKKPATRKIYKKKATKKFTKRSNTTSTKSLVKLIKSVSLKSAETKSTHQVTENQQLYHNTPSQFTGLCNTSQGITDTETGGSSFSNRIGDAVVARGISLKLWIANKLDRPNVMYRLVVYKHQSLSGPTATGIFKGANGNRMMDDINKELVSVVYQKIINLQTGLAAAGDASGNPFIGKECHTYRTIWIPLKNKQIVYNDSGSTPKFFNYAFSITPYDSYGTLITDNIASLNFQHKFYFKDP